MMSPNKGQSSPPLRPCSAPRTSGTSGSATVGSISDPQLPPSTPQSRHNGKDSASLTLGTPNSSLEEFPDVNQTYTHESNESLPGHSWWPEDSDDSGDTTMPSLPKPNRSSTRVFRSFAKRLGRSFSKNYFLPNDLQELERNDLQHVLRKDILDGKLHLAPIANPRNVLDVGTGSGIWAMDFASLYPDCAVYGVDLNPISPARRPPNCRFEVADVTQPWDFTDEKFDFIFVRSLGEISSQDSKRAFVQSVHDSLMPGGWVEIQEWVVHLQSPDHSLDGTALQKWNFLLEKGMQKMGKSLFFPYQYKSMFQELGFEKAIERKYPVPSNTWPPGKQNKKLGALMNANVQDIFQVLTVPIFTRALGWSVKDAEAFVQDVKRDYNNTNIHSYLTLMTVSCQKPRERTSSTVSLAGKSWHTVPGTATGENS